MRTIGLLAALVIGVGCMGPDQLSQGRLGAGGMLEMDGSDDAAAADAGPACSAACKAKIDDLWTRYLGAVAAEMNAESEYWAAYRSAYQMRVPIYAAECANVDPCTYETPDEYATKDPVVVAAAANVASYQARRDAAYATYSGAATAAGLTLMAKVQ